MNNKTDYILEVRSNIAVVKSSGLANRGCFHGFTTRIGGISEAPYDTLNLGWNRNEPKENIRANYEALCKAYSMDFTKAVLVNYEHGASIEAVNRDNAGNGMITENTLKPCDGLITNDKEITLFTLHADCACIFAYHKKSSSVGIAHSGWKGAYSLVGKNLIRKMCETYSIKASEIITCIGPCICEKCFEVGIELAESFADKFSCKDIYYKHENKDKAYLDLRKAISLQLESAGVPMENQFTIPICTFENEKLFYSYRRDNRCSGAMAGFIRAE